MQGVGNSSDFIEKKKQFLFLQWGTDREFFFLCCSIVFLGLFLEAGVLLLTRFIFVSTRSWIWYGWQLLFISRMTVYFMKYGVSDWKNDFSNEMNMREMCYCHSFMSLTSVLSEWTYFSTFWYSWYWMAFIAGNWLLINWKTVFQFLEIFHSNLSPLLRIYGLVVV